MASLPSKRYEWIDNSRVIAALLIMYVHWTACMKEPVNVDLVKQITDNIVLCGRVPFFLILAGYFLSRSISWKKAFSRALWLFIPFILWNMYVLYELRAPGYDGSLLGMKYLFTKSWEVGISPTKSPVITASWFLRDIILLTLATPLLVKIKRALPFVLLVLVGIYAGGSTRPSSEVALSSGTIAFYILGILLSRFSIEDAYRIFNRRFTPFFIAGLVLGIFMSVKNNMCAGTDWWNMRWSTSFPALLFGAMMIAHAGVLIEQHLPALSRRMSICGPACFLVFMAHNECFRILRREWSAIFGYDPVCSYYSLFLPLGVLAVILGFYFLMKWSVPFLLPIVAHIPWKVAMKKYRNRRNQEAQQQRVQLPAVNPANC